MRYEPHDSLAGRPHVIVDGYPTTGTVLTLSHWRGSGTPEVLKDDLSTQIAFRYLDHPELRAGAELVSNNHFDQDGACGIFAVLHADEALARRDRIVDVASAGDFETYRDRDSARIAFALASIGSYEEALPRMAELFDHPSRFESLWAAEDTRLSESLAALDGGRVAIEERPDIDLAIVTVAPGALAHPFAIHNATSCMRVLEVHASSYRLYFRYETWVDYRSRSLAPRPDLNVLAKELNEIEPGWSGDDGLERDGDSAIPAAEFRTMVERALR